MIYPVILTGGAGTRLWPLSRKSLPKPLLQLTGDETMLQETVRRLEGLPAFLEEEVAPPSFITNDDYRFVIAEQLAQIGCTPRCLILEPDARNTGPAIAASAMLIAESDPDGVVLLLPADHIIDDTAAFHKAVAAAVRTARDGYIVTFGIVPNRPETGYGYIQIGEPISEGSYKVARFVEKPQPEAAAQFLESGRYLWNSGMFTAPVRLLLAEFSGYAPELSAAVDAAVSGAKRDLDFLRLDPESFARCPSISIDYAVMERTECAAVIPADLPWSDVGSWLTLYERSSADVNGNVLQGPVIIADSSGCYVRSENRLVGILGVTDLVIIETTDAVLVTHRDRAQSLRDLIVQLDREGRKEHLEHRRVHRPWGSYETVDRGDRFQVKRLIVKPGGKSSMQVHHHRSEHWVVVQGTANVSIGNEVKQVTENESIYIPVGVPHRIHNPGRIPLHFIEVQSGSYLEEDDIVRLDDQYGREGTQ